MFGRTGISPISVASAWILASSAGILGWVFDVFACRCLDACIMFASLESRLYFHNVRHRFHSKPVQTSVEPIISHIDCNTDTGRSCRCTDKYITSQYQKRADFVTLHTVSNQSTLEAGAVTMIHPVTLSKSRTLLPRSVWCQTLTNVKVSKKVDGTGRKKYHVGRRREVCHWKEQTPERGWWH